MLSCAASAVRSGRSTLFRGVGLRGMATGQDLKLPALPYDYDALAPVIIPEIMEIHHTKHHQAYVTGFNNALAQLKDAEAKTDPSAIVGLQSALKFNGGGHINHAIFWKSLIPPKEFQPPSGPLEEQIKATWGSLDTFTAKFNAAAAGVQGSGWGWLAYNPETKGLQIATTANQDPLQPTTKLIPLLGVDVWEHAYYLQYKNVRPDYLKEIWKVINWKEAGDRFAAASKA